MKIYNEDNALGIMWGVRNNSKTKWNLIKFILGVLFKDRKETLASLVKILKDNFRVKVSVKTEKQSFTCIWYWMDKADIETKIWLKDQEK